MADRGENNPKNTVAPNSDGGGTVPKPVYSAIVEQKIEKQLKAQEQQTAAIDALKNKLLKQNADIHAANKILAQENAKDEKDRDNRAIESARKAIAVSEALKGDINEQMKAVQEEAKKTQESVNRTLNRLSKMGVLNESEVAYGKEIGAAAKAVKKSVSELENALTENQEEQRTEFEEFLREMQIENEVNRKFEEEANKKFDDLISSAWRPSDSTEENNLKEVMEKTKLSLDTLAVINEEMSSAMSEAGVDKEDKKAVERFKMQMVMDKKFNETIVKELVKSRDTLKSDTVKKELQEKYIRMGIPANTAAVKAEKDAEEEYKRRVKQADEEIRIFKEMNDTQKFQTTLVEMDYRSRIEKEKEKEGFPEWYLDLKKKLEGVDSGMKDLMDAFGKSGIFGKIFLVLSAIAGVIVGFIAEAIKKIVDLFKTGGGIAKFIASLEKYFPTLSKMFTSLVKMGTRVVNFFKGIATALRTLSAGAETAGPIMKLLGNAVTPIVRIMNAFGMGLSIGTKIASGLFKVLGKVFVPLGIILTVIDGVIGAFKGFKKDGIKGILAGAISQIISSLTFGLVEFDTIYKVLSKVLGVVMAPLNLIIEYFSFVWDSLKAVWGLVSDLFSGKGIAKSFSTFFGKMQEAFGKFLYGIYDSTVGAFFRLFGMTDDTIKEMYIKITGFFLEYNPFALIYKGITSLGKWIGTVIPDLMGKIKDGIVGVVGAMWDGIKSKFSWLLSWLGIDMGGGTKEPTMTAAQTERGKEARTRFEKSLKIAKQAKESPEDREAMRLMMAGGGKPQPTTNITTVNNTTAMAGGGGKPQPPTLVAPQPPRNTEPTNRTLQWESSPAF